MFDLLGINGGGILLIILKDAESRTHGNLLYSLGGNLKEIFVLNQSINVKTDNIQTHHCCSCCIVKQKSTVTLHIHFIKTLASLR